MKTEEISNVKNDYKNIDGPHQNQHIIHFGTILEDAEAAMIMIHGRGASAHDIFITCLRNRYSRHCIHSTPSKR